MFFLCISSHYHFKTNRTVHCFINRMQLRLLALKPYPRYIDEGKVLGNYVLLVPFTILPDAKLKLMNRQSDSVGEPAYEAKSVVFLYNVPGNFVVCKRGNNFFSVVYLKLLTVVIRFIPVTHLNWNTPTPPISVRQK